MSRRFSAEDEGKRVVTSDGDVVGEIERTENDTAFVRPCSELIACYGSLLTGCWETKSPFPLDASAVTAVEEDRVRIRVDRSTEKGTLHPSSR